jgi:hypothetical protein
VFTQRAVFGKSGAGLVYRLRPPGTARIKQGRVRLPEGEHRLYGQRLEVVQHRHTLHDQLRIIAIHPTQQVEAHQPESDVGNHQYDYEQLELSQCRWLIMKAGGGGPGHIVASKAKFYD